MPGERPFNLRSTSGPSPCPAMILPAKFTKRASDSMNFVNFAGKRQCFQDAPPMPRSGAAPPAGRCRRAFGASAGAKLTLPAPGPIPARAPPMESLE